MKKPSRKKGVIKGSLKSLPEKNIVKKIKDCILFSQLTGIYNKLSHKQKRIPAIIEAYNEKKREIKNQVL